jgi:hypothetical protein
VVELPRAESGLKVPSALLQPVFVAALAASALLMFLIQPMVGKTVLPALGGTPQVWNTCMVFFQAMLFLGYLHAHYTARLVGARRQAMLHLALAAAALLLIPFGISPTRLAAPDAVHPVAWLMQALLVSVGVPVFLLSATAPLLQKWFAQTRHPAAHDPYHLYVASNVGSLLALLAYPVLVEPLADLPSQWLGWSAGFAVLVGLLLACAALARRDRATSATGGTAASAATPAGPAVTSDVTARQRLHWLALSFVPSSLLLGVTTTITTDIAPVPLFWVVPLALYLLTFIIAFSARPWIGSAGPMRLQVICLSLIATLSLLPTLAVLLSTVAAALHLLAFFCTALVCHGELVRRRPEASRLTEFYLWLSLGGLLGGIFNALVAPVIFTQLIEYPLVLAFACALRPAPPADAPARARWLDLLLPALLALWALATVRYAAAMHQLSPVAGSLFLIAGLGGVAMALLSFGDRPARLALGMLVTTALAAAHVTVSDARTGESQLEARTFFGTYKVRLVEAAGLKVFIHGTTVHGAQYLDPARALEPGSYYHRAGPFADVFRAIDGRIGNRPVSVVGLGVGTLASYGRPGGLWTFYEIDPLVVQVASDPAQFTFLRDSPPDKRTVIGDARLTLERAPDQSQAVIVIDAFTSDSIPTHLLTREAMAVYLRKLAPDGLLAIHISNRHLRLAPVVGNLALDAGLVGRVSRIARDTPPTGPAGSGAELVVLARDTTHLGTLANDPAWTALPSNPSARVWSDGYVNILRAMFVRD